jgi:hypothetical protein
MKIQRKKFACVKLETWLLHHHHSQSEEIRKSVRPNLDLPNVKVTTLFRMSASGQAD